MARDWILGFVVRASERGAWPRREPALGCTVLVLIGALACDGSKKVHRASQPDVPSASANTQATAATAPSLAASSPRFTVATYNVNAGMAGDEATLTALRQIEADMVFLQETTREWEQPIRRELTDRYPHMAFRSYRDRFGGLAILSRIPFDGGSLLRARHGPFPAWLITVDTAVGPVQILNLHLFPPVRWHERGWLHAYADSQDVHLREVQDFNKALAPGLSTLIVGDLNEAAAGKAASWLMAQGLAPAVDSTIATWRWQTELGEVRWQLDHILYSGPLEVLDAKVLEVGSSDHFPVIATFGLQQAQVSSK